MDNSNTKIIYASLADKNMADKIARSLNSRGISSGFDTDHKGMNHLYILNEKDLEMAVDYFRVAIGEPPKMDVPEEWQEIKRLPMGQFTFAILAICIVAFGVGWLMKEKWLYDALMFGPKQKDLTFSFIQSGEFWRLLTPAFIHFGFMHVLFNLLWWKDLANILENTKGAVFLGFFLITTAISSNLLQAYMVGPNFGGLSGVVYALLGYLWIYKYIYPSAKFGLPKADVVLMIGWFILCLFDIFPFGVANWAHGGGLVMGMLFGLFIGLKDKTTNNSHSG